MEERNKRKTIKENKKRKREEGKRGCNSGTGRQEKIKF